jgi:hypothetical protein
MPEQHFGFHCRILPAVMIGEDLREGVDTLHWIRADRCWKNASVHYVQVPRSPDSEIARNYAVRLARSHFVRRLHVGGGDDCPVGDEAPILLNGIGLFGIQVRKWQASWEGLRSG